MSPRRRSVVSWCPGLALVDQCTCAELAGGPCLAAGRRRATVAGRCDSSEVRLVAEAAPPESGGVDVERVWQKNRPRGADEALEEADVVVLCWQHGSEVAACMV